MQRFTSSVSSSSPRQQITATSTTILQLSKSNYVPKLYNHCTGIPRSVRVNIAKRSAEGTSFFSASALLQILFFFHQFSKFFILSNSQFCSIIQFCPNFVQFYPFCPNLSILSNFDNIVSRGRLKISILFTCQFFVFCRSFLFEFLR